MKKQQPIRETGQAFTFKTGRTGRKIVDTQRSVSTSRVTGDSFNVVAYGLTSAPLPYDISKQDLQKAIDALWRKRQRINRQVEAILCKEKK